MILEKKKTGGKMERLADDNSQYHQHWKQHYECMDCNTTELLIRKVTPTSLEPDRKGWKFSCKTCRRAWFGLT